MEKKKRIVNPPKRKPDKAYGGSADPPLSIRLWKQLFPRKNTAKRRP